MSTKTHGDAAEPAAGGVEDTRRPELDSQGWPILHAASEMCDGRHPITSQVCVIGYHRGPHRAEDDRQWLDDE